MQEFKILLIGCGSIGNRHIESILNLKTKTQIFITIIEKNIKNINKKFFDIKKKNFYVSIYQNEIPKRSYKYDLCIISANSSDRLFILNKIKNIKFRTIILEKLLADNLNNLINLKKIMKKMNVKNVYVNTPRRYMNVFKNIKKKLDLKNPLSINYTATNFKLGSNSIHIIDLFKYFTDNLPICKIFCDINKIIKIKNNFFDFQGFLLMKDKKYNTIFIDNVRQNVDIRTGFGGIKILNYPKSFIFNEQFNELIEITENTKFLKSNIILKKARFNLQSELTGDYVKKLINDEILDLPNFDTSYKSHYVCFKAFENSLNKINKSLTKYSIT